MNIQHLKQETTTSVQTKTPNEKELKRTAERTKETHNMRKLEKNVREGERERERERERKQYYTVAQFFTEMRPPPHPFPPSLSPTPIPFLGYRPSSISCALPPYSKHLTPKLRAASAVLLPVPNRFSRTASTPSTAPGASEDETDESKTPGENGPHRTNTRDRRRSKVGRRFFVSRGKMAEESRDPACGGSCEVSLPPCGGD